MFTLHLHYLLKLKAVGKVVVPTKSWYNKQRESVGIEAWVWAMMKVAAAEYVLQHEGDETGLDRQGTYAQWVLTEDCQGETEIVTIEPGVVVGRRHCRRGQGAR